MALRKFWKLNATCHISPETAELRIWISLKKMRKTRICGEYEGERNDHTLHYGQVFGNVFERRESKCCGVLMRHRRKVRGEQVTTLLIAQQIKTKNINVIPGQLFCRHCKAKFLLETRTHCNDDEDKVQSVTDTDNEFTECQTPRKKLNWHFTCQSTRCTSTQPYK